MFLFFIFIFILNYYILTTIWFKEQQQTYWCLFFYKKNVHHMRIFHVHIPFVKCKTNGIGHRSRLFIFRKRRWWQICNFKTDWWAVIYTGNAKGDITRALPQKCRLIVHLHGFSPAHTPRQSHKKYISKEIFKIKVRLNEPGFCFF